MSEQRFSNAPRGWSSERARELAHAEGLDLAEDHWEVIAALHEYFARHDIRDVRVRELRDALDERFHRKGGSRYLYQLFPAGPVAQGCRIAGLPVPAGSVDPGFGSVQ